MQNTMIYGPFASLIKYRELYWQVLVRDIQSSFRGSALGLAWIAIVPAALVAIYSFVFGTILNAGWPVPPQSKLDIPLIYFTGIALFGFLMEVINRAPSQIRDNRTFVVKVVFPLDILSWVLVGTALFRLLVNLLLVVIVKVFLSGGVDMSIVVLPLVLLPFILIAVAVGWLLSAVGAYLRDLTHLIQAISPILLFVSPVFYAMQQVPHDWQAVLFLNPLSFVLETARGAIFYDTLPTSKAYAAFAAASIVALYIGHMAFSGLRKGFADVV